MSTLLEIFEKELSTIETNTLKKDDFTYDPDIMTCIDMLNDTQKILFKKMVYIMERINAFSLHEYNKPMSSVIPLDEIKQFESDNNIIIPLELKLYLCCISRGIFKPHLSWQNVELSVDNIFMMPDINDNNEDERYNLRDQIARNLDVDELFIKTDNTRLNNSNRKIKELSIDEYNNKKEILKKTFVTKVLRIREVGCGYNDHIITNASNNQYIGEIWHDDFTCGGQFYKLSNSFFEYLLRDTDW